VIGLRARAFVIVLILVLASVALPAFALENRSATKSRFLWIETGANLVTLSSRERIAAMLDKAKAAGITHIVPEAKNAWGYVIYESSLAPHIRDSLTPRIWPPNQYDPPRDWMPRDFDPLAVLIEEAHKRGIKVHAAVNVFSEGLNRTKEGRAFLNPPWQSVYYIANRYIIAPTGVKYPITRVGGIRGQDELIIYPSEMYRVSPANQWGAELLIKDNEVIAVLDRASTNEPPPTIPEGAYVLSGNGKARDFLLENFKIGEPVLFSPVETALVRAGDLVSEIFAFVNAANSDIQNYELWVIGELLSLYNLDGIVLDRARWWNYYADFSDENRRAFEAFIGRKVKDWPEDVFSYAPTKYFYEIVAGPLWNKWQGWRAWVIYEFFRKATAMIRQVKPDIEIGNYVGGWYPYYWREGLNWGAAGYDPGFSWTNAVWIGSGIAQFFDYLMVGSYYPEIYEAESLALNQPQWMSVEGVANLARQVTLGRTRVVNSLLLTDFSKNPARPREAMKVSDALVDGIMLFDLVFLEQLQWWNLISP
jgi:uncharacterized lipoprotein YddW (UPF0748 family)